MSNNQSPRRNSNPFSERISSLLQLRQQIAQQQAALSEKIEQDLRRLDSIQPQGNNNSLREVFSAMDGFEIQNRTHQIPDMDMNNIDLYCEPECPFDNASESDSPESNEMDDNKYESSDEDMELNDLSNKFAVSVDIYEKVSFNNFDFHKWLKTFDLICIKEILVFRGLQLKDSWTKENFEIILSHPLIKRDEKLLSQIQSMLNVFKSVKRRDLTGKHVWENDTDDDNTDNETPSFMDAIIQSHFQNKDSNLVSFKGLTFKLKDEMSPMPPMPSNSYHFQ